MVQNIDNVESVYFFSQISSKHHGVVDNALDCHAKGLEFICHDKIFSHEFVHNQVDLILWVIV
jgi:hypothetical protein